MWVIEQTQTGALDAVLGILSSARQALPGMPISVNSISRFAAIISIAIAIVSTDPAANRESQPARTV